MKPKLEKEVWFHCIHCGKQIRLELKEDHARRHGYKEIPRPPRQKKRPQATLPGIIPPVRSKYQTD